MFGIPTIHSLLQKFCLKEFLLKQLFNILYLEPSWSGREKTTSASATYPTRNTKTADMYGLTVGSCLVYQLFTHLYKSFV